jgi:hypothetical protein
MACTMGTTAGHQPSLSPAVPVYCTREAVSRVLSMLHRAISIHLIHKARLKPKHGATGGVAVIDHSGSALKLNFRFQANSPTTEILYTARYVKRIRSGQMSGKP